ncbi:MAG: Abi family protein [Bacteroidota bacterium]
MEYSKLISLFSKNRLNRYVQVCNGDQSKAVSLYECNIRLSQALHPLISLLEVGLRNAIDREICKHYNDNEWLINQRHDFANHIDLTYKDYQGNVQSDTFFMDKLQKAEGKIKFGGGNVTHVKLIAELTFGFWVKFFDNCPIKVLKGVPLQSFKNRPSIKLKDVHSHLNKVVTLRNRISHNEPICFNKQGGLCLTTIKAYEDDIISALGWIDSDLKDWGEGINGFPPIYDSIVTLQKPTIYTMKIEALAP